MILLIFSVIQPKHTTEMKSSVLAMCQVGTHVLLALKPGTLVAVSTSSFQSECEIMEPELARDDLFQMLTLNDQIAIAYKTGTVALVSGLNCEEGNVKEQTIKDDMMSAAVTKHKDIKLSVTVVKFSYMQLKHVNQEAVIKWNCGVDVITVSLKYSPMTGPHN